MQDLTIQQTSQVNTLVIGVDTLMVGVDAILAQIREIKDLQKSQLVGDGVCINCRD